ncbi:hypothetical protein TD95_001412 [Thielaviopsis punctulata]|uniref:V-type proton ATPase subunit n=1 Tax=Thielaviopsis punctulata TaxID=72032 RepID=A0A0F4Z940_9PEZI|nr:hypothetical protein TD95_001412 [Thielaviopsis punctulata]
MATGASIFVGLFICIAMAVASYMFSPKGPNQILWRSSLILAIVSCYLMWAITFLAQLNPLVAPNRIDLRVPSGHEI